MPASFAARMNALRAVSASRTPARAAWAASQAVRYELPRFAGAQATNCSAASRTLFTVRRRPGTSGAEGEGGGDGHAAQLIAGRKVPGPAAIGDPSQQERRWPQQRLSAQGGRTMLRATTSVALILLATAAPAQFRRAPEYYPSQPAPEYYPSRPPPEYYPPPDAEYRGTERLMCVVNPGLEQYRSRLTCELGSYQPLGTSCACPSFQSQGQRELPGRVVRR